MTLMPHIPNTDALMNRAFGRASKKASVIRSKNKQWMAREKELIRVGIAADIMHEDLKNVVKNTFSYEGISKFYQELLRALIDIDHFKLSLGAVGWASNEVTEIAKNYRGRILNTKTTNEARDQRRDLYGRLVSVLKRIDRDLDYLADVKRVVDELPKIKELPTVVIAGSPNVGKSSLLKALTGSRVDIQPYPFTTKGLLVSYRMGTYDKIQIIDTPGLLDRELEQRNNIERQAVAALRHLAQLIIFVYDPTESCGYPMETQRKLASDVKNELGIKTMEVYNKADMQKVEGFSISTKTGEGIEELWEVIVKDLKA